MEQRIRQIEESIMLVTRNLEKSNHEELDDIMEMSLPFLPDTSKWFLSLKFLKI